MAENYPLLGRTLGRQTVFRGKRFSVRYDQVEVTKSRVVQWEVIEHQNAVTIVPVDHQGNVLLVRQFRPPTGQVLLELPAGTIEAGEEPEDCARRELREETGFAAKHFKELGHFWTMPGIGSECMYAFLATGLRLDPLPADEDEEIQLEQLSVTEVMEMARTGQIHDAKSVAALFMAEHLLS
jgi:ADP-ribose pyrophosphatase